MDSVLLLAITDCSGLGMVADVYKANELGSIMSKVLVANMLGFLVGPVLGGVLNDYVGPRAPYFVCAGLTGLDFLARMIIISPVSMNQVEDSVIENNVQSSDKIDINTPTTIKRDDLGNKPVSFYQLLSDPQVVVTVFTIILAATVFSGIEPTLPLYLESKFNMTPSQIGLLYISIIIPNAVSGLIAGPLSDKYGRKNITALGLLLFAVSCPLIAVCNTILGMGFALGFFGGMNGIVQTPTFPEMAGTIHKTLDL